MGIDGVTKRGILATSTDLGAISAILSIGVLSALIQRAKNLHWFWAIGALLIFVLSVVSGTISGSRGFFLAFAMGLLTVVYQFCGGRIKLMLSGTLPLIFISLLLLQAAPENVHRKLGGISPVFASLGLGIPVSTEDFKLHGARAALGDRADLWERGIEEVLAQPWLGMSNGGYRILNESLGVAPINNVHNAFLQLAVDAGVGGFLLGLVTILLLCKVVRGSCQAPVLAAILAGLLVDNYADHSLAWIAIATYTMANCTMVVMPLPITKYLTLPTIAASTLCSITILIGLFSLHHQRHIAYESLPLAEQINAAANYFFIDYWNIPPIMMTEALALDLKDVRREEGLKLYPSIAVSDLCAYSYPGSRLMYLSREQTALNSSKYRSMSDQWGLTSEMPECRDIKAKNPSQISNWISNYHLHYGTQLTKANATMVLITDHIAFFSPVFEASERQSLVLSIMSKDLEGAKPTLVVSFYDATSGAELSSAPYLPETGTSRVKFSLPSAPSGVGFLKLRLQGWRKDSEKNLRQQIDINNVIFLPR
jgi:hypothetical protein